MHPKNKIIHFDLIGTSEGPEHNPIPYTRTTQRGKFSDRYQRYVEWKRFVVSRYLDAAFPITKPIKREDLGDLHDLLEKKPIVKGVRAQISINCRFGKDNHPDPDNVVKGIADALFMDDKHVDVATEHSCHHEHPSVEVTITFR